MSQLPDLQELEAVAASIDHVVPPTPQISWPLLNERTGCELWVKHENHTAIGSFKIRGALHYLSMRAANGSVRDGIVAATRGNYGQAVAFAARRVGLRATIVVPHGNSPEKNRAMRALGAELIEHGADFQAALIYGESLAKERGLHWMPAFHRDLYTGIAASLLAFFRNVPALDMLYVPIGLGSGICAAIAVRDALGSPTRIIGVAAERAPAYALSFEAKGPVVHPASTRIADGMACSTPVPEALEIILRGVDRVVRVIDEEIEAAMRAYFMDAHTVAEGAAGSALGAVLRDRGAVAGKRVGVILTGGNVDAAVFARILGGGQA